MENIRSETLKPGRKFYLSRQSETVFKRAAADVGQTVGQNERGKRYAVLKCPVSDRSQLLQSGLIDKSQLRTVGKAPELISFSFAPSSKITLSRLVQFAKA